MSRDFVGALLQLNAEKQVSREQLIHAVEDGIQSAYRRVAGDEDIQVRIDAETGSLRVFRAKTAVDEVEDPLVEFSVDDARKFKSDARPGELVETEELKDDVFGRIGAQTAKQIVLQRLREVEREQVFDKFANREGEMITGSVNRVEPRAIILDVGNNVEAVLATSEQSAVEHYRIGQNVKAYVLEVRRSSRGPQILVSRTHKGFLKRLFELEVPEVHAGTVEIKAIAREPGSRSKVAVSSRQDGLDPVGATVGQRGARVQAVVAELGGEKIDIIPWNDDASVFVANALSPAQVISVDIDEEKRIANVTVPERMLSLAIGREGPERSSRRPPDGLADRHPERRLGRRQGGRGRGRVGDRACRPRGGERQRNRGAPRSPRRFQRVRGGAAGQAAPEPRDDEDRRRAKAAAAKATAAKATAAKAEAEPKRRRAGAGCGRRDGGGSGRGRRPRRTRRRSRSPEPGRLRPARWRRSADRERCATPRSRPGRVSRAGRHGRSASSSGSSGRPTGEMIIDETGRVAGRGAYLCRDAGCWTLAVERGALGRALEAPVPPTCARRWRRDRRY